MTNYYDSVSNSRDTILTKTKFGSSGYSPNSTNTSRRWLASLFLLMSIFIGQMSFGQVNLYSFAESTETYAQITGTNSTAAGDDAAQSNIAIGFPFTFGLVAYTNFGVSTNGFIRLNNATAPTASAATNSITNSGTNRPLIAAFWDDNNRSAGSISYSVTGTTPNRILSVNWHNVKIGGGGSTLGASVSAIIRLYETTNVIEIVYGSPFTTTNTLSASVGLNDATSFLSVTPAVTSTVSSTTANNLISAATIANLAGKKLTFTPPVPCTGTPAPGNTIASTTSLCQSVLTVVNLSLQNATSGTGVTYQWFNNAGSIAGATAATYTTPGLSAADSYFCNVTCSAVTTASTPVAFNVINCNLNTTYSTGVPYVSIMPVNGGTGVAFSGWVDTTSGDDNTSTAVSLAGTTFTYQGTAVTAFQACSNGWMTFNTPTTQVQWANNLSVAATPKLLAPLWDDLVFTGQSYANRDASMRYQVSGTLGSGSAVITVEWAGMERFLLAGPNLNFQVKLYESDNHIEYIYGVMDAFDGTLAAAANYSYSVGYNGSNPAGTTSVDRFALQAVGQNYFGTDATVGGVLNSLPACNSKYTFTPGTYSGLTVAPVAVAPSNDNSAGAINLNVTGSPISTYCGTYYSSKNATNSGLGFACGTATGNEDDDVWFKFNTTLATDYTLKLRSSTNYNGVMQLFDSAFAPISCANLSGIGLTETINATALTAGGTTYYIRVFHDGATIGTSSGDFSVSVNEVILPPTNDNIAGATTLTVGATCTPTNSQLPSTLAATASVTTLATCNTPDDDVWYSFVATSAANVISVQSGTGYNAAFQVVSSSDNTATGTLTQVACLNVTTTGGVETFAGALVTGNTYFVRVFHAAAGAASGNFSICVTAPIPTCVEGRVPADLAVDVATNQVLSWTAAANATSYDVFFGTTATGAVFIANQVGTSYTPVLAPSTSYTWKVVAKNANGSATGCTELSFTTAIPPGCTQLNSPLNGATGVPAGNIPFSWAAPAVTTSATAATSYDLFYRTSLTGTKLLIGNFIATNASVTLSDYNTTFYVTVVPKNANGIATGCAETSFTTGGNPFSPYCSSITYTSRVEPITSVNFAGINNTSSEALGGASIENFISIVGNVATGIPYTMTLKGNTDGAFTDNFGVFADWNQDGDFADAGETYNAGSVNESTGVDAISAVSTILVPSTALLGNTRMRIKKIFNSPSTDPCTGGGFGQTEDYTINVVQSNTTSLTPAACGATLPIITSVIYATPKGGAVTGYRFEVTIPSRPLVAAQTIDRPLQFFNLTQLASYEYATTYSVRVMLRVGTEWLGYYGPACTVTTPGVSPSPTVGPATVSSPACGSTLNSRGATIYTTPLVNVTGYRFRIKTAGQQDVILDRTLQFFSFNAVSTFVYGSTYTVEVSIKTTGDYLPYGTPCTFNTQEAMVADATCGATIVAGGTIYAKAVTSAVSYKFEVTKLSDIVPNPIVFSRSVQYMPTSLLVGYSSAASYSIRVAIETTAGVSPFGTACIINSIAEARKVMNQSIVFSAVAFPNPFETNFTINLPTSNNEIVTVAVYDMIGKLLENKVLSASELSTYEIGATFRTGVYNVIVSQGAEVKSIRMVKR